MATFRGRPACSCLIAWLPVYERALLADQQIKHSIDIYQLIGAAQQSAGTHARGGAFDIAQYSTKAIRIARQMGAATWHRTPAQGFIHHAHGILKGCTHNSGGAYQVNALDAGYNGLGAGGRGGRDDGPRDGIHLPLRTWKEGIEWAGRHYEWNAPAPKPFTIGSKAAVHTKVEQALIDMLTAGGVTPVFDRAGETWTANSARLAGQGKTFLDGID